MAFGGANAFVIPPVAKGAFANRFVGLGATLAARAGAPTVAAADTGTFTTDQTPAANLTALPANFGPGEGNWVAGDENLVRVLIQDRNAAAQGGAGETSIVTVSLISVVAGDLQIQFHNHGAQASGALKIDGDFVHSLVK